MSREQAGSNCADYLVPRNLSKRGSFALACSDSLFIISMLTLFNPDAGNQGVNNIAIAGVPMTLIVSSFIRCQSLRGLGKRFIK